MADWFYDKQITLLKEIEGHMYHGSWIDGTLSPFKTISCDVQPASREQIFKDYGYYIDCTKRVFCDVDTDIVDGDIVEYKGIQFKINKIIEWDDYFDIFMKEVNANG